VRDAKAVLVDTGPLVALFDPSERARSRCERELGKLQGRQLVTTLAVITEATHLLAFSNRAQLSMLEFVARGALTIAEFGGGDVAKAAALMARYADLPMDFADATLLVLAERLKLETVFTLDRRDFTIYRIGRKRLRLVPR
jgi:predicted nucleic acid-binding protein